jgi:hypothetical protein
MFDSDFPFEPLKKMGVRLELDTILSLRVFPALEEKLRGESLWAIRTLVSFRIGLEADGTPRKGDDPAGEALLKWKRSSAEDYQLIIANLEKASKMDKIKDPNIMEPVQHGGAAGIYEVKARKYNARLFVFYDTTLRRLIVAAGAYWKLGRNLAKERELQNSAILKAAQRRDLWVNAEPVPGHANWRVFRHEID